MTLPTGSRHIMQKVIPTKIVTSEDMTYRKHRAITIESQSIGRRSISDLILDSLSSSDDTRSETLQTECGFDKDLLDSDAVDPTLSKTSSSGTILSTVRSLQQSLSFRLTKRASAVESKLSGNAGETDTEELMMNIIRNQIGLGHFLAFCQSEFNSEYLQLYVAVENFRLKEATEVGQYSIGFAKENVKDGKEYWRSMDEAVMGLTANNRTLQLNARRKEEIMSIWDKFFQDKDETAADFDGILEKASSRTRKSSFLMTKPLSPNYVFLPKAVSISTLRRLEHYDLYGADVFSEAVTEALKVLHRDIFPRFLKSSLYEMNIKRRLSYDLSETFHPPSTSLVVKPPQSQILNELSNRVIHAEGKLYTLKEILRDGILYNEFLTRLKKKGVSQYMLCVQLIAVFKESITERQNLTSNITSDSIIDQAWVVYLHFVSEGSSHRILLMAEHTKQIQLSLGNPAIDSFDELESVAMGELTMLFNRYRGTENYQNLASRALHTAKNILKVEGGTARSRRPPKDPVLSLYSRMNIR